MVADPPVVVLSRTGHCDWGWVVADPDILHDSAAWLQSRARNIHSQFGEDGLIEACVEKFGAENRWCLEVGAGDGVRLSNTKVLREQGWSAVLIEADAELFSRLVSHKSESVRCVEERIGPDSLDRILREAGAPTDLDFASIDIDGQDYWVWRELVEFKPRIVSIEFNPYERDDEPAPPRGSDTPQQAGIDVMTSLAHAKGYAVLCKTYCNIICVRDELVNGHRAG